MNHITINEGIIVAFLISCAAYGSGYFGGVFLLYTLYLVCRMRSGKARLLIGTIGVTLALLNIMISSSFSLVLARGAAIIALTRWCLVSPSLLTLGIEAFLYAASLGAAYWMWGHSGSRVVALWSFFLVQSLRVVLPGVEKKNISPHTSEFNRAYDAATRALSRMMVVGICFALPFTSHAAEQAAQPHIDVVFALDTTGSMGGLIQSAKEKIWSVAMTLAKGTPTPRIRVGLIGYRDRGDAYVTKQVALTNDLDALYAKLMEFEANGGGDTPESVNQALHEAVDSFDWDKDKNAYRVIFLVGDAPPHMDYQGEVKYQTSVRAALKKGIIVNTIQCGGMTETTPVWQEIAKLGEGTFAQVEQSGGAASATSPYDEKLAALANELEGTRLSYGSKEVQDLLREKKSRAVGIDKNAPVAAKAGRARWNVSSAGSASYRGDKDLLDGIEQKTIALDSIKNEELPDELKNLSAKEKEEKVQKLIAKKNALSKEIQDLSTQRQSFLAEKAKKEGKDTNSLDAHLFDAIKKQTKEKGISYSDGPVY